MKKYASIAIICAILATIGSTEAAKYKVNTSGTVKNSSGQVITSPANSTNQNYYNNYYTQNYIASNQVNATQAGIVEIVMDYSGSMANWITVAKRSMAAIISQIPSNVQLGFRVFGHDSYGNNPTTTNTLQEIKKIVRKGNKFSVVTEASSLGSTSGVCAATQQVTGISTANASNILAGMNSVDLGGATPLVYALDRTVNQDFKPYGTTSAKKIVLITDGGENCGGDPCAFAKKLMQTRSDVHIDVVLVSSNSRSLTCLANYTGGKFYTINNLADFSNVLTDSIQSVPQEVTKQNYEYIPED